MEDHGNRHGDRERGGYEEHNESYLTYSSSKYKFKIN